MLTSGLGTDNTIQTIWTVPPGIALTDFDNALTTGSTESKAGTFLRVVIN